MTLGSQGQGHGGNDLGWVGVLISGYPRFLTSFYCMTLGSQGQGHGGNDLGWVGARHLYLNFDDPRLLVLISGILDF